MSFLGIKIPLDKSVVMKFHFTIKGEKYSFNPELYWDISIPINFDGKQPNAFSLPKASAHPVKTKKFLGDVLKGGSCNCFSVNFISHGNGTHTEGIGHIDKKKTSLNKILSNIFIPCAVITLTPEKRKEDRVITKALCQNALKKMNFSFLKGLVVRVLPNLEKKKRMNYSGQNPPYFLVEAVNFLLECGINHLLIDLPSLDQEKDKKLKAHRAFWNKNPFSTITEMIYVPNQVKDGIYLLNLQIPSFILESAPSRPILFPIHRNFK